jgi:hypothetical protein
MLLSRWIKFELLPYKLDLTWTLLLSPKDDTLFELRGIPTPDDLEVLSMTDPPLV